jgi:hypothetical protein
MKNLLTFVAILICLSSCSSKNPSGTSVVKSPLDSVKLYTKKNNEWLTTRIYQHADIDSTGHIDSATHTNTILFLQELHHAPDTYDDQHWIKVYILIPDSIKIELGKDYHIPNDSIAIKAIEGGAWMGRQKLTQLSGLLRFENSNSDSATIRISLTAQMPNPENKSNMRNFIHGKYVIYKNGRSDWEF